MLVCAQCCEQYTRCRNCQCGERIGQACELCGHHSLGVRNCTFSYKIVEQLIREFNDAGKACKSTERQIVRIDITKTAVHGRYRHG